MTASLYVQDISKLGFMLPSEREKQSWALLVACTHGCVPDATETHNTVL